MSDIFHEVDEEVRREQLKKLWDRYQYYVIALAAVVLIGIGGWRASEWWEARKAAENGVAFEAAVALSDEGKHAEAAGAFARIAAEGTSGYRTLARLREAAALSEQDKKGAAALYEKIAADTALSQVFRDLAALRAGAILVDTGTYPEALRVLEPVTAAGRPFRHSAREFLALAAWRASDRAAAQRWFDMITTDAQTPGANRSRIEMLMALMAADGKS